MKKKNLINKLIFQGANGLQLLDACEQLEAAGLLSPGNGELTSREVAAVLVATTTPHGVNAGDYVINTMNLVDEEGLTFGEALQNILESDPHENGVARLTMCQTFPWARIKYLSGNCWEFATADFNPCWIRTESVVSGGMIAMLAMAMQHPTESGWTDRPLDANGATI